MKVLFAVSNEKISDTIVEEYQKKYKEIISYKNVYYFNAILKEIQKDKSYDRIVISEDLEAFSNNNYEAIDKFIFEKLDDISDEAQDIDGNETSIVLICSDRHTKGCAFLVKIFGIGIYNALLGSDRNTSNVCELINKPRVKKEAKSYYKIDTEDVNYSNKSDSEVSELEIQNIITHFRKLGKNTEKYSESFNSIASQYTDEQLKIVINCLPMNVKAVLEEDCQKYQQLMSVNGKIQKVNSPEQKAKEARKQTGIKIDIIENRSAKNKISGPIVIPSSVKTSGKKKVSTSKPEVKIVTPTEEVKKPTVVKKVVKKEPTVKSVVEAEEKPVYQKKVLPDGRVVRVKPKNPNAINTSAVKMEKPIKKVESTNDVLEEDEVKLPPKKKIGEVKKKEEVVDDLDDDEILPGMEDEQVNETLSKAEESEELDDDVLPGMDDDDVEEDDDVLPGMDDDEVEEDDDDVLPGMDDDEVEEDDDDDVLPGMDDDEVEEDDDDVLPGMDDDEVEEDETEEDSDDDVLPGMDDEEEYTDEVNLPGLDDLDDLDEDTSSSSSNKSSKTTNEDDSEDLLFGLEDDEEDEEENSTSEDNSSKEIESIKPKIDYSMSSLNSLLTKDKKIVTFLGTTKNGTSFLINNLAALFSSLGINTAILDMTKNKNSFYIYTNNEEDLRNIAYNSISKLQKGFAEGIKVNKNRNLTVYTALPNDGKDYSDAEPILSTLVQNHSLILIDCDFDTDPSYFASCQEIYLVQSMDILTIQPLTAFLRDLKSKGVLEPEKVRVVINKEVKVRSLTTKVIIGGMSFYNDPSMSFMTELFNKDMVKACSIPFEEAAYSKYLDSMATCNLTISGYSKTFISKLKNLGEMVYPLVGKPNYGSKAPSSQLNYDATNFSGNMGNTLNKMKKNNSKNKF